MISKSSMRLKIVSAHQREYLIKLCRKWTGRYYISTVIRGILAGMMIIFEQA